MLGNISHLLLVFINSCRISKQIIYHNHPAEFHNKFISALESLLLFHNYPFFHMRLNRHGEKMPEASMNEEASAGEEVVQS